MKDLWIKIGAGLIVAAASAGAGAYATTKSNEVRIDTVEGKIERIEDNLDYIRGRVDAIYDRLPARGQ